MMRRRVLIVCDDLENGGKQRQIALLARALPPEWEPRVASLRDGPYRAVIEQAGVRLDIHQLRYRRDVSPAFALWNTLKQWQPDVVHCWGWMGSTATLPGCRAHGIAHVDGSIRRGFRTRAWWDPRTIGMRGSDFVIANSAAGLRSWGISPRRGRVVYNGFDPDRMSRVGSPDRPSLPFTAVMTARMYPQKDFSAVLRAARLLAGEDDGSWRFLLIGTGPDRGRLLEASAGLRARGVVEIIDAGLEVLPYLSRAHVGVLMSDPVLHAEGCSNSLLEYMACALPVVCSEGGGNREVVDEGVTGLLVPAGDAESLAAALHELRERPEWAAQLGRAGVARLRSRFSVEAMVRGTVRVYEEARAAHRPAHRHAHR